MTDRPFGFTLHATDGQARLGTVQTLHGDIRTPAFMPVGTVGTVKGLYLDQVEATGADIILGNTYHLMLRPGAEEVAKLGGLHHFIGWKRPDPHRLGRLPDHVALQDPQDHRAGRDLPVAYRRQAATS